MNRQDSAPSLSSILNSYFEDSTQNKPTDASSTVDEDDNMPLQIIVNDEHSFRLMETALEHVLLNPRVSQMEVAVISIAGAFRKGKSFMLNFFLRYLQRLESGIAIDEWIGNEQDQINGFSWRGGVTACTAGILIWKHPFIIRRHNGSQVAVLVMDTQGAFDNESTVKDCATVFALSTMISSVQIFNLSINIQEDSLQHLQLFAEYGRLALTECDDGKKPFQNLLFLIRDWQCPYDYEFGFNGGQKLINNKLKTSDDQHPQLRALRQHIISSFEKIECCLMPHPGLNVATDPYFKGTIGELRSDFKTELRQLVPHVLSPENLVIKRIRGEPVTCLQLVEYFKAYTGVFQGQTLPEPKSMLEATAEANNLAAVANSKEYYRIQMEKVCGGDQPFMNHEELCREHERIRQEAVDKFSNKRKMGGVKFSQRFLDRLQLDILTLYIAFSKANESKNLLKALRTPVTLIVIFLLDHFMAGLFDLLSLSPFSRAFSQMSMSMLLVSFFWVYSRYFGRFRKFSVLIDSVADYTWHHLLADLFTHGFQRGATFSKNLSNVGVDFDLVPISKSDLSSPTISTNKPSQKPIAKSRSNII